MSAREQLVWAAAYAAHPHPGLEAAAAAEQVVSSLGSVEWPEQEEPEYRAARLCRGLSFDEFREWYVVELRMLYSGKPRASTPSEADIGEAYKIYAMCSSDFY